MICNHCQIAAEFNRKRKSNEAIEFHNACKGCECQHKVGTEWFVRKGEAIPQMRTQSP